MCWASQGYMKNPISCTRKFVLCTIKHTVYRNLVVLLSDMIVLYESKRRHLWVVVSTCKVVADIVGR